MAAQAPGDTGMKQTLGLTGVTINAMALIAPGAFLWTTFQSQSAAGAASMWPAVFVAVLIALLTAIAYAALSHRYPEAGTGSSYYYAEVAVLHQQEHRHFKFARLSKFVVGWASHLYYWIYPGVMVAFMGNLISYIIGLVNPNYTSSPWILILICVVFSIVVGAIAYVGVTGSTLANILINVIQILALITLSIAFIVFRLKNPSLPNHAQYIQSTGLATLTPKGFNDLLFQSTIAILLVVGFESATALAAESKNPKRDIPRGVILSLIIQGVIFYLFEYFAANFAMGSYYTSTVKGVTETDFTLAADSARTTAPIGDLAQYVGNHLFNGNGTLFAFVIAITVVLALIGTALSCLNTGVRVTYAMGKDKELPGVFGFLHGRFRTPHVAVIVLVVISAIVGSYGVLNGDTLIQVTLVSNIGTFLLYGMTCLICVVAYAGVAGRNVFSTIIAPIAGAFLNIVMLIGVIYFATGGSTATAATKNDTIIAALFSIAWLIIGFAFLYGRKIISGVPVLHPEDYKAKSVPEVSVEAGGD